MNILKIYTKKVTMCHLLLETGWSRIRMVFDFFGFSHTSRYPDMVGKVSDVRRRNTDIVENSPLFSRPWNTNHLTLPHAAFAITRLSITFWHQKNSLVIIVVCVEHGGSRASYAMNVDVNLLRSSNDSSSAGRCFRNARRNRLRKNVAKSLSQNLLITATYRHRSSVVSAQ